MNSSMVSAPLVQGDTVSAGNANAFGSYSVATSAACEADYGVTTLATDSENTETGLNCLPANAVIDSVVYRITTTITKAASLTIGDAVTPARFCTTQSKLTAGATGVCFAQEDQKGTAGPRQVSNGKVRVVCNAAPGAGAIRVIVYYHTVTPPTS